MKKIHIILFLLSLPLQVLAQSYNTIHRAEKAIEQKNYEKALRLLDRAEKQDYGFCGNASLEADRMITQLRYRAYKETGDKNGLKKLLNEIDPFFEVTTTYSKERLSLALDIYTKDEIDANIRQVLINFKEDIESFATNSITVNISREYILKLHFDFLDILTIEKEHHLNLMTLL